MTRAVLLDVDGCLVDSRRPILASLNAALRSFGLPELRPDELHRFVGPPLGYMAPGLLAERGGDPHDADELIRRYRDDYAISSIELAASYPGVPEAVAELAEKRTLGVVTSKPIHFARPILEALDLAQYMAVLEGPSLTEAEPKTATLARALGRLRLADGPEHVMVGDRHHDVEAGRAHGLSTVGVTWGFGTAEELLEAGATAIVDEPAALPGAVLDL